MISKLTISLMAYSSIHSGYDDGEKHVPEGSRYTEKLGPRKVRAVDNINIFDLSLIHI